MYTRREPPEIVETIKGLMQERNVDKKELLIACKCFNSSEYLNGILEGYDPITHFVMGEVADYLETHMRYWQALKETHNKWYWSK